MKITRTDLTKTRAQDQADLEALRASREPPTPSGPRAIAEQTKASQQPLQQPQEANLSVRQQDQPLSD